MAGLGAIGVDGNLALIRQAISMFGQLARVVKKNDEIFSPLEEVFYDDKEDREELLLRFIIEHASDFTDRAR